MLQERHLKRRRGRPSSTIPSSSSQSSLLSIDRISTLPDPILHDILNFLPTKYAARTSALSNRFNALWFTYPILDFNEFDHHRNRKKDKLLHRMQRSYLTHDFSFLEKFKIRVREPIKSVLNKNLSTVVDMFILRAVYANTLKEVQLHFPVSKKPPTIQDLLLRHRFYRRFYLLPEIPLFSFCESLKFLTLRGCRFEGNVDMNNHGIVVPFLNVLVMKYCVLPDDNFISKIIDGCPQLEKLSFKYCIPGKVVQFRSSMLKTLVLGCYDSSIRFEIVTPNVKSLKITATHWKHTSFNVLMRLVPHHLVSAPNLEILTFKDVYLGNEGIKMVLSAFKNLKGMEINRCVFIDEPNFEGQKIEKLDFSHSAFNVDKLFICSSKLPQTKLVNLFSCTGLKKLTLRSRGGMVFNVEECDPFDEFHKINLD